MSTSGLVRDCCLFRLALRLLKLAKNLAASFLFGTTTLISAYTGLITANGLFDPAFYSFVLSLAVVNLQDFWCL